jgi:hypothetical protein
MLAADAHRRRGRTPPSTTAELLPQAQPSRPRKRELHQRTSSGDWSRDKVTWSEEISYKKVMGYV